MPLTDEDILAARERIASGAVPWDRDRAVTNAIVAAAQKRALRRKRRLMLAAASVVVMMLAAMMLWVTR